MLQNVRVTAFTVSELLRENQQVGRGRGIKSHPQAHRLGLNQTYRIIRPSSIPEYVRYVIQNI